MPDDEVFETVIFEYDRIRKRLRELAFLNNGITIVITDHREENKSETFHYEGGIVEFVDEMNEGKQCILKKPIFIKTLSKNGTGDIELAFQYNDGYKEVIHGYANNINTIEGGTHIEGFKKALLKTINEYGHKLKILKDADKLTGDDVREGITAIVSVKLQEPQFEGQTKTKLGNSYMQTEVYNAVCDLFGTYLEENPDEARS